MATEADEAQRTKRTTRSSSKKKAAASPTQKTEASAAAAKTATEANIAKEKELGMELTNSHCTCSLGLAQFAAGVVQMSSLNCRTRSFECSQTCAL